MAKTDVRSKWVDGNLRFIKVSDGETILELNGTTGKPSLAANTITATAIAANAVTTAKIKDGNVTAGKFADGTGLPALIAAGLGASENYDKETVGAKTLVAANEATDGDRAFLLTIVVTEAFADDNTDDQTKFTFGQTDAATAYADATLLDDAAISKVFVLAGTLDEEKALLVTGTAAEGAATGEISVTAILLPKASE